MGFIAIMVACCTKSTKSVSDTSSVFMELETVSVMSFPNDEEVVEVTVVLCKFSPVTLSEKRNNYKQ